jgi:hypothetical protein
VAWTGAGIHPEKRLASSGAQPRGDPTGEAAGELCGVAARGLCEQWSAGHGGCASSAGCALRAKIEWRRRARGRRGTGD